MRKSEDSKLEKDNANIIVEDNPLYYNKHVALSEFIDGKVIAYDKDLPVAIQKARENGYPDPVMVYCHDPKIHQTYFSA